MDIFILYMRTILYIRERSLCLIKYEQKKAFAVVFFFKSNFVVQYGIFLLFFVST